MKFVAILLGLWFLMLPTISSALTEERSVIVHEVVAESEFELPIQGISNDPEYGFTPDKPILLGGIPHQQMDQRIAQYFTLVTAPDGTLIPWERLHTCCPFPTEHDEIDHEGSLHIYAIAMPGQRRMRIFVNHYDDGPLFALAGTQYYRSLDEASALLPIRQAMAAEDLETANRLLRQPAAAGIMLAQFYMGLIQTARNQWPEALPWLLKAAEQGHSLAQRLAGMILLKSPKSGYNGQQGIQWLRKAANNRDPEARSRLARELRTGQNVQKDLRQARMWTRLAAEQGSVLAQWDYGLSLLQGDEMAKGEGLGWIALAATAGHSNARELFEKSARNSPPSLIHSAKQFAQQWPIQELPSEVLYQYWVKAEADDHVAQWQLAKALHSGVMTNRQIEGALFYAILASEVGTPGALTLVETITRNLPQETLERIHREVGAWKPG